MKTIERLTQWYRNTVQVHYWNPVAEVLWKDFEQKWCLFPLSPFALMAALMLTLPLYLISRGTAVTWFSLAYVAVVVARTRALTRGRNSALAMTALDRFRRDTLLGFTQVAIAHSIPDTLFVSSMLWNMYAPLPPWILGMPVLVSLGGVAALLQWLLAAARRGQKRATESAAAAVKKLRASSPRRR